ncbi:hypothetical protein ABZ957_15510 [Streptomyces sp. NPDC046316]|uniref:hypothetical protein n=1 Tax=Streptomyces sp. NPDC046316 TaxID=3154494 RepID=UPI0033FBF9EE
MNVYDPANARPMTPMTEEQAKAHADRLIREAYGPTSYRDDSPLPLVGTAPPVAQPGRPAMSQRATDISGIATAVGLSSVPISLGTCAVLWTAGQLDPIVLGLVVGAPVGLALALSRVLRRAKETVEAAPPEQHHHYTGPVFQDHRSVTTTTTTRGVFARTNNDVRK